MNLKNNRCIKLVNNNLKLKENIIEIEKILINFGLVIGPAGNVSCRSNEKDKILITPSGVNRENISTNEIILIDLNGKIIEGKLAPSREVTMHLLIYKSFKEAGAIIHSHPPFSTALSIIRKPIPPLLDEFVVFVGEEVKAADYAISGSQELADNALKALGNNKAVLLSNHGLLCYGKDLDEALFITRLVEETAKSYTYALSIGAPYKIPEKIIKDLKKLTEK